MDLAEAGDLIAGLGDARPHLLEYMQTTQGQGQGQGQANERLSREFMKDAQELRQYAHPSASLTWDQFSSQRARPPVLQPLSTVPYSSPIPARHVVSLVDVLDIDPLLLEKVRLLSAVPVGPGTGKDKLKSLDDELFGCLDSVDSHDDDSWTPGDSHATASAQSAAKTHTNTSTNTRSADSSKTILDQQSAKQRVWAKLEADKQRRAQKESIERAARLQIKHERLVREAEEPLLQRSEVFASKVDARVGLDLTGKGKKPAVGALESSSVESALAKEKTVQLLQLTNVSAPLPGAVAIEVVESFLRPFQLEVLRKVDFTNARIGPVGGTALARALTARCLLLDLRLGGCNLGDTACLRVLQAIRLGSSRETGPVLQVLDLSNNTLTMITDGLAGLGAIPSLQYLDLSRNKLTMDLPRHHATLAAALGPLLHLSALSLAHNNIQDVGFGILCGILLAPRTLSNVVFLDLRACFLTPLSFGNVMLFIKESSARAWTGPGVQLQHNLFKGEQIVELNYSAHIRDIPLHFADAPEVLLDDAMACPYVVVEPEAAPDNAAAAAEETPVQELPRAAGLQEDES